MQTTSAQHHLALKAVHGQQQGRHRSHSSIHARSSPLNPDDATATLPVPVVDGDVSTACSSSTASPSPSPKPEPPLSSPSPKPQQGDCVASSGVVSLPKNSAGGGDNDSQATPSRTTRTMTHDDDDEDEDESYFDTTTGTDDDDDDVGEDDVPSPGADDDGRTPPSRSGRWGTGGGEDAADDGSRRAGELLLVDDRDVDLSLSDEELDVQPFLPMGSNNGRRSRHVRGGRSFSLSSATAPTTNRPLPLPWLTLNLLNTTLSPSLLALPYVVKLLGPTLFIPLLVIIAFLSAAAHVVLLYLGRYLGVRRYEDLVAKALGGSRKTVLVVRVLLVGTAWSSLVLYLCMMADVLAPLGQAFVPTAAVLGSPAFWAAIGAFFVLPLLLPRQLNSPTVLRASLASVACFIALVIVLLVKTVALSRGEISAPSPPSDPSFPLPARRSDFGTLLGGTAGPTSSVWGGMSLLTFILTSHLSTLPNHLLLGARKPQYHHIHDGSIATQFLYSASTYQRTLAHALAPLFATALLLPLALVPYFLLDDVSGNLLEGFRKDDRGLVWAHFAAFGLALTSAPTLVLPAREAASRVVKTFIVGSNGGRRRGESDKQFWALTMGIWVSALGVAALGGRTAEVVGLGAVLGSLAFGFLIPSILFVILFHLRRPLSIIFPSTSSTSSPTPGTTNSPSINANANIDALLAKKERQLQRRRSGRRIWQDGVVFLGSLPVGLVVCVWTVGRIVGAW